MQLKTKKLIAREFLMLAIVIALGIMPFVCMYPYNALRHHQVEKVSSAITERTKLADSLSHSYNFKFDNHAWIFDKMSSTFDFQYKTEAEAWSRIDYLASMDSIKFKWENVWPPFVIAFCNEIGFATPDTFKKFIVANRISSKDSADKKTSLIIYEEIDKLRIEKVGLESKVFSFQDQIGYAILSLIIFAILLFVVRYLFYAIRWSIKTLKQKE